MTPERRRRILAAVGVLAAALVVGVCATVAYALATGFDRSARTADLPDVVVRFDPARRADVDARIRTLPNLAARSYRYDVDGVSLRAGGHSTRRGTLQIVLPGRRGYAIVQGRDLDPKASHDAREVVVEQGVAREWDVQVDDRIDVGRLGRLRVAGIARAPDNVAFPLASAARVYVGEGLVARRVPRGDELGVNRALLWLHDRSRTDVTLTQARGQAYGIGGVSFLTREGVQTLIGQAAGIVVALLIAFALVALAAAGIMLGTAAHADVQRRMPGTAIRRALGFSRGAIAREAAVRAGAVALPAAAIGLAAGWALAIGPTGSLLAILNGAPAGWAALPLLAVCLVAIVTLVVATSAWPAYRATAPSPAALLRGGELATRTTRRPGRLRLRPRPAPSPKPNPCRGRGRGPGPDPPDAGPDARAGSGDAWGIDGPSGARSATRTRESRQAGATAAVGRRSRRVRAATGPLSLGPRLVMAARGRYLGTVVVLGACTAVVLLMLALASTLERLRDDPTTLGKRFALTVSADRSDLADLRSVPGVAAASPRWVIQAAGSFQLGEALTVIAFPGDHTQFEEPPLAEGRRLRADDEAEVGVGLADALGLAPGATLGLALPDGAGEARFRVVGIVRALDDEGRVAYVRPRRLGSALTDRPPIAVRIASGASREEVQKRLQARGYGTVVVSGAVGSSATLLALLSSVLRIVALVVALVVLYALAQALALTAGQRMRTLALLRTIGASGATTAAVLAGAGAALVLPACALAIGLQELVLGPLVASLATGYADLPVHASAAQAALVSAALLGLALLAGAWVARRLNRVPLALALRERP
jgi:ABC-type lipoprotein release transport system permease subunit